MFGVSAPSLFRLIRKVLQILLHQRPVLLRIFLRLRLLNRRAITLRQTNECSCTAGSASRAVRSARAGEISLIATAARWRCALAFSLSRLIALALAFSFSL